MSLAVILGEVPSSKQTDKTTMRRVNDAARPKYGSSNLLTMANPQLGNNSAVPLNQCVISDIHFF
jgi:hypothetical protein